MNGKLFSNNLVKLYLEFVKVDNYFEHFYHLQNQGEIDAFNKTDQRELSFADDNVKQNEIEWDLELSLLNFYIILIEFGIRLQQFNFLKFVMNNFN